MKRPPSISQPEDVAPPRRRRGLSDDERVLWESVAKQTKPLRERHRAAKATGAPPPEPTSAVATAAVAPNPQPTKGIVKAAKPPTAPPAPPLAPLGRRERLQLSRGRKDIDGRIDLHGMTQTRAHHALHRFLQRASDDGLTFVLVITGKGRTVGPESVRGVLRRQVPHWLSLPEFRSFVIGFEEAHIGHGGEGALYVRVRRAR
jgi:DNA-nicking Smr family endonuclease